MMISVIITTRDRPTSLRRTLDSLAATTIPDGVSWETVVVDNGIPGEAHEVVVHFATTSGLDVRYLHEPRPGTCRAKNLGIQVARGEILAFTDDDITVDPRWLSQIRDEFHGDPDLALLTGRIVMRGAGRQVLFVRGGASRESFRFPCNPRRIGAGGNMALRTSAIGPIGLFDERLGPGVRRWGGADVDYFYRTIQASTKVLYSPDLLVSHEGDQVPYRIRLPYGWGAVLAKHILRGDRWMAHLLVAQTQRFLSAIVDRRASHRAKTLRKLLALYAGAGQWVVLVAGGRLRSLWGGRPH